MKGHPLTSDAPSANNFVRNLVNTPNVLAQDPEDTVRLLLEMEDDLAKLLETQAGWPENPDAAVDALVDLLRGDSTEHVQTVVLLDEDNNVVAVEDLWDDLAGANIYASSFHGIPVGDLVMHGMEIPSMVDGVDSDIVVTGHSIHLIEAATGSTLTTLTSASQKEYQGA